MTSEIEKNIENLEDNDPKKIIYEVLCRLQKSLKKDEIFLSEADFQFCFAQELDKVLKNKGIESPKIILEYPFITKELYSENKTEGSYDYKYCEYLKRKMCSNCRKEQKDKDKCHKQELCFSEKNRSSIDLYYEYEKRAVYIEFKYKTKRVSDVERGSSKKFILKDHSNETDQRHDVYKDIERIEHCLKWHKNNSKTECFGYAIFITNNKSHWNPISTAKKYRLCDKTTHKCRDEKEYVCTTKDFESTWSSFRTMGKCEDNGQFNVCLIDCNEV